MRSKKCRSRQRSRKFKGGSGSKSSGSSGSSGSSLLRELEGKYSETSLPNSASVEKMLDELNPASKSEKSGFAVLGVVIGVVALVIVGKKFIK